METTTGIFVAVAFLCIVYAQIRIRSSLLCQQDTSPNTRHERYIIWDGLSQRNCSILATVPNPHRINVTMVIPSGGCLGNARFIDDERTTNLRPCHWTFFVTSSNSVEIEFESENEAGDVSIHMTSIQSNPDDCSCLVGVTSNSSGSINYRHPRHRRCPIVLIAPDAYNIRVRFTSGSFVGTSTICDTNYIHMGSNRHNVDQRTASSHKLCGNLSNVEFVSRDNVMWMAFHLLRYKHNFNITYEVIKEVTCDNSTTSFQCSSVQCISRHQICDNQLDCSNGNDEYCDPAFLSNGEPCFMCEDGQCIYPRRAFYEYNAGADLWWLCDDYWHCMDGTDERADVCFNLRGRRRAMFQCLSLNPAHAQSGVNFSIMILRRFMCDGVSHCLHSVDESPQVCSDGHGVAFIMPTSWIYIICMLTGLIVLAVIVCHVIGTRASTIPQAGSDRRSSADYALVGTPPPGVPNAGHPRDTIPVIAPAADNNDDRPVDTTDIEIITSTSDNTDAIVTTKAT